MDSLCHPCITATHLADSVLSLKLLPPPCAVLLVKYTQDYAGYLPFLARSDKWHMRPEVLDFQGLAWHNCCKTRNMWFFTDAAAISFLCHAYLFALLSLWYVLAATQLYSMLGPCNAWYRLQGTVNSKPNKIHRKLAFRLFAALGLPDVRYLYSDLRRKTSTKLLRSHGENESCFRSSNKIRTGNGAKILGGFSSIPEPHFIVPHDSLTPQ